MGPFGHVFFRARDHADEFARVADFEQRKATEMIGAELGYCYADSPLIAAETGEWPAPEFMRYVPTTRPGARLPHVWLDDGSAIQDRIGYGHGYTLLRLGPTRSDARALEQAFAAAGAPLRILNIRDRRPRELYGYDLLLLRPDLHIAWRGNTPAGSPDRIRSPSRIIWWGAGYNHRNKRNQIVAKRLTMDTP